MLKHINKSIPAQFNRQIHTLNKPIYRNRVTHFNKNAVNINKGFQYGFYRFVHQIIDDTNYRWDPKYIKNNLRNLDKNLEWLKSLNSLERYIGDEQDPKSFEDSRDLLIKLDVFNHVDKIEEGYKSLDLEILTKYLESKYKLLETIVPLLPNTSVEFRRKYLITNPFIQYLYRLVSSNIADLNTHILIKYFNFLLEVDINDLNELLKKLYLGIYNSLEEEINEEHKIDTRIKLLSKIIFKEDFDINGLKVEIQEVLTDCMCNSRVFYSNINETIQILYSIHQYNINNINNVSNMMKSRELVESGDGVLSKLSSIMSTDSMNNVDMMKGSDQMNRIYIADNRDTMDTMDRSDNLDSSYVTNYLEVFVEKLRNYIYMLDNNTLINILYVFYKMDYMDDELFSKVIESIIFKFESLSYEQMEAVVGILSTYKYYYMLNGYEYLLGESLYGEGGKMLVSMIREYFENKLVNLQLSKMIDPLIALTTISKKNRMLKPLILKKLDSNLMEKLKIEEFSKLLMLFSNIKIDKANEQVSELIEKYVNNKLMIETNTNKIEEPSRLINSNDNNIENIIKQLSRFMPKKKYSRFMRNYVDKYLSIVENSSTIGSNMISNGSSNTNSTNNNNSSLISLMRTCLENKIYKFDNNEVINKLLSRFITSIMPIRNTTDTRNDIMTDSTRTSSYTSITINNSIDNRDLMNSMNRMDSMAINNMDMDDMITLLEAVDHSNLSFNNVYLMSDILLRSIYDRIKGSSKINLKYIYGILNFMVNTRIVNKELMDYILEYLYDYYIITIPEMPKIERIENKLDEIDNMSKDSNNSNIISTSNISGGSNHFKVGLYILYLKCVKFLDYKKIDIKNKEQKQYEEYENKENYEDKESKENNDIEFKEMMDNTYSYIINHFNNSDIEYYISNKNGKKMVENFRELLIFEKSNCNNSNSSSNISNISDSNNISSVENRYSSNNRYNSNKDNKDRYYEWLVEQMRPGVIEYLTEFSDLFKINSGKMYSKMVEKLDSTYSSYYEIEGIRYDFYSEKYNEAVHILKKEHYYVKEGENGVHLKNKGELMKRVTEKLGIKLKLIPEHSIFEEETKFVLK